MRYLFLLCAALMVFVPSEAKAWGKYGHLTVCDLAYRNLTPASRTELNDILQSRSGGTYVRGRGKLPDRTYTSFNLGCLEEDELPRKHPDDHFINLGRDVLSVAATCPADVAGGECILGGIQRDLDILSDKSRSREDRVFALMALGHWLGDIHQPLHVSFADDRGGNWIDVKVMGGCGTSGYRATNLHAVWDNCILEAGLFQRVRKRADYKKSWNKRTVTYRAVDTLMSNTSLADEKAIVAGTPQAWAGESYSITRSADVRYCELSGNMCRYSSESPTLPKGGKRRLMTLDQAYLAKFDRSAEDRIRKAGFRLAHLLNGALDPDYLTPLRDGLQP
jgi:S1/P1 Nuclease